MATDPYGQSITIPALTDPPNISTAGTSLSAIVGKTVLYFASATSRNATITSPVEGMLAWLQDVNTLTVYDGTAWQSVHMGTSAWLNLTPAAGFTTPQGTLQIAQYRLITVWGTQRVELRGSFDATADVTGQVQFATMPVGYRPSVLRSLPVTRGFNSTTSGMTRIEIDTTGAATVFGSTSPAQTSWFCMDGLFYDL